jgi:hypothetical protein
MKEDTMAEKAIEEQVMDAENVPEAQLEIEGTFEGAEYMKTEPVLSAGQVYIYDTKTHERSVCRRNNLTHKLKLKRADGSQIFTTVKPKTPPKRGTLKCMLHPDMRKPEYDDWGFPVCKKANLNNPFQVRRHMEKRHKDEYRAIKEGQDKIEKDREREERNAILALAGAKQEPPMYVKEKKK